MKEIWTTMASLMGVWAFSQTLLHAVFPPELRFIFIKLFQRLFNCCSSYCYYDITEIEGVNTNELYNAVQLYLSSAASSSCSPASSSRLSLTRGLNSSAITFGLSHNDRLTDVFNGVSVVWEHIVTPRQSQTFSWRPLPEEKRGFTLRINKRDKPYILESYLDYINGKANEIRRKNEDRLLYTNSRGGSLDSRGQPWESVPFKHPSTFETLAMDPVKKAEIMSDLRDFADGQAFYTRTGRAWKRGYLLYGPPGTGKSSMIAAMANFLGYDIYDLELTEVQTNLELRKLLMKTSSKSIIVIEDIDCSINLTNRKKTNGEGGSEMRNGPGGLGGPGDPENSNSITLSGLLNFTDGLWSCCGSERIFVFTTNHIEKLDPALLRSGRMDMHVFMSYCSFPSLKILLKNYLGCSPADVETEVLRRLEEVTEAAEMTPADISEVLIKNRRNNRKALKELLQALKAKAEKNKNGLRRIEATEEEKRAVEGGGGAAEERWMGSG
ncbi:AAA-ATPase At5g57480 [Cynara cardunculus var. scolymus]|uniref:AAA+ ATPase domain-containing protein n=1 Tax=Cynara cardunculus var. scolymus TaxID=59895 RepID=A0A103YMI7_CYNCS|nr:AAA-ATPase At5g57480 [Cynara cardunculus var. scolymus]KVI11804.1 AAA+ ATPase domain-containing protein [Cynara cardunculus var. scolymus]